MAELKQLSNKRINSSLPTLTSTSTNKLGAAYPSRPVKPVNGDILSSFAPKSWLKEKRDLVRAKVDKVARNVQARVQYRPHTAQISASLATAAFLWFLARRYYARALIATSNNAALANAVLPPLSAALSQGVALVGALDLHSEVRNQLGVSAAVSRQFALVSAFGHALSALAQLPLLGSAVGRVFFSFNALILAVHAHIAYLTMAYNWRLESRSRPLLVVPSFAGRARVNVPALGAWLALQLTVVGVWLNEAGSSLSAAKAPSSSEALAALGFALQSLASVRAGLRASMTSTASLPSLNAALTLAAAQSLAALSLLPLSATSAVARIYLAGYASTLYASLLNAYYAYRMERERERARVPTAVYRLRAKY